MPTTITGDPSVVTPGQDVVMMAPADGDQALVEGIVGPFQLIANVLKYLVNFAASVFNTGHEWTGLHVFHSTNAGVESLRASNSAGGPALRVDLGTTIVQDLTSASLTVGGQISNPAVPKAGCRVAWSNGNPSIVAGTSFGRMAGVALLGTQSNSGVLVFTFSPVFAAPPLVLGTVVVGGIAGTVAPLTSGGALQSGEVVVQTSSGAGVDWQHTSGFADLFFYGS